MIARTLEAFFRHKLLLFLPPIIIPLIVGPIALLTTPSYYETWAGIWVDQPTYISYTGGLDAYISPAQSQTNRLSELLRTQSFLMDVAKRTSLAPLVGTQTGQDRVYQTFWEGFSMTPNGAHLIIIRFRGNNAQIPFEMVNAIIDAYKEKSATDRVDQAQLAISFYTDRLKSSEDQLNKSTAALRSYLDANPQVADANGNTAGLSVADLNPQFAQLRSNLERDQKDVESLRSSVEQATLDTSAALEGQELGFQVIDPAYQPKAPTRDVRKRIIFPIAGAVIGLVLSAVLLVLFVAGDRSVRLESDVDPPLPVLGTVPRLRFKKLPKKLGPTGTRRAIGFVAGTALPEPKGTR